ncbi:MAG: hypothetical protein ACOYM2_21580 [Rectinemataceae bacterium]
MKVKTSITMSSELLSEVDKLAPLGARSDFIEKAVRRYVELLNRDLRNRRDLAMLDENSVVLNGEAMDVLAYQSPI